MHEIRGCAAASPVHALFDRRCFVYYRTVPASVLVILVGDTSKNVEITRTYHGFWSW